MQADYDAPDVPLPEILDAFRKDGALGAKSAFLALKHYRDVATRQWSRVRDQLVRAYERCPQRKILVAGHSQGNIVLRYVIRNLPVKVRDQIVRVDLVSDPTAQAGQDAGLQHTGTYDSRASKGIDTFANSFNPFFKQTPYPGDIAGRIYQYCIPYDTVCDAPGNPIGESARHMSYNWGAIGRGAAVELAKGATWKVPGTTVGGRPASTSRILAPSGIAVAVTATNSLTFSWRPVPGADSYVL